MAPNLSFFCKARSSNTSQKADIKPVYRDVWSIRAKNPLHDESTVAKKNTKTSRQLNMVVYREKGSSLIEVMVSLFILAIGLLGILAMQVKSVQFSQSADTYTRAMNLANDIAERIRINPKNVSAYASETIPTTEPTSCKTATIGTSAACSATDLVKWDLFNWSNTVKNSLPMGTGSISLKTQGSKNYLQITVSFDDSRSNGTAGSAKKYYTLLVESPTQLGGA